MSSGTPFSARPPLRRSRNQAVAGVSTGLAEHLGISVTLVRAIFIVGTGVSGAGALFYAWCWAMMPLADDQSGSAPDTVTRRWPTAWILTAIATALSIIASGGMLAHANPPWWFTVGVAAQALAVCGALWAGLLDQSDPERGPRHVWWVRVIATAAIALMIVLGLATVSAGGQALLTLVSVIFGVVALAGVYAPLLITQFRALSRDRIQRIKEEQRSEMAAHLHDSVLQTLALIQNRAEPSSEVARIARAQERELRSWLYDGDELADSDLPTDLRDYAAALELDYAVHIDVVAAGTATERASGDLAAAAREAMLNAARHAGGEVSVYIESRPHTVEVFIRDRGPGFSLDDVPVDRLGVRQSVIGRMRRAGGSAEVRPGAGRIGTEIRLKLDRAEPARTEQPTPPPASAGVPEGAQHHD